MAALFQFLIAVLLLCVQTLLAATDNNDSSSTTGRDVFPAASDYVPTSRFNNDNTSIVGVVKPTHTRTPTAASDVGTQTVDNVDSLVVSGDSSTAVDTDTQTVHAGNAARESVHGQSADNVMNTGNVARESVDRQTTNNVMNTSNVGSETARGQTVGTTNGTGINVTSEVDATSAADSVVSEGVAGPGVDAQTLTSAMNSGHGESVTAVSEDVGSADTVFSSVQNRYNYDDVISAETVFTSTVMTTVVETFSPLITNSPVTPTEDCDAVLCEKDAGYFIINSSACAANDSPTFDTSMPTAVKILTSASSDVMCYWNINVPERNYVSVSIDQLVLEHEARNVTQTLEFYVETDFNVSRVFNTSVLSNRAVTFTSSSTVHFRFRGRDLHLASPITFRFVIERGTIVEGLPVGRLTDTVSYVTSPRFNGLDLFYPNNYDGEFHLHVSHDEFVFISFTHTSLWRCIAIAISIIWS